MNEVGIQKASIDEIIDYFADVAKEDRQKIALLKASRQITDRTFQSAQKLSNQENEMRSLKRLIQLKVKIFPKLIAAIKGQGGAIIAAVESFAKILLKVKKLFKGSTPNNAVVEHLEMLSECAVTLQVFMQLAEVIELLNSWQNDPVIVIMMNDIVRQLKIIYMEYRHIREICYNTIVMNNRRSANNSFIMICLLTDIYTLMILFTFFKSFMIIFALLMLYVNAVKIRHCGRFRLSKLYTRYDF